MDLDQDVLAAHDAAKEELNEIYDLRGKEAIFRSKAKWIEEGEKPTRYLFNLEKRNYEKKTILETGKQPRICRLKFWHLIKASLFTCAELNAYIMTIKLNYFFTQKKRLNEENSSSACV